jgi:hypothetical protein
MTWQFQTNKQKRYAQNVHGRLIHNSTKQETPQVFIKRKLGKKSVVCSCSRMLSNSKKEQTPGTCKIWMDVKSSLLLGKFKKTIHCIISFA